MQTAPPFHPTFCPLCGKTNGCAMEAERLTGIPQGPCWCTQTHFPAELLARIPEPARGKACVCAACASRPASGFVNPV